MSSGSRPNSRADFRESGSVTKLELKNSRNMSQQRARSIPIADNCCERPGSPVISDFELDGHAMDKYLASIGLARMRISPENSLFRAICDEIYFCQTTEMVGFVEDIVEQTAEVDFKTTRIREGDEDMIPGEMGDRLRAAAKIFDAVIRVFKDPSLPPMIYYPPDRKSVVRQILLCETRPRHFDRVVQIRRLEASNMAKAILCDTIYSKVCAKTRSIEEDANRDRTKSQQDSEVTDSPTEATPDNSGKQEFSDRKPSHQEIPPSITSATEKAMDQAAAGDWSVPREGTTRSSSEGRNHSGPPAEDKPPVPFPRGSLCLTRTEGGAQRARVLAVQDATNRKLIFEDATVKVMSIYDLRNGTRVAKPESSEPHATSNTTPSQQNPVPYVLPLTPLTGGFPTVAQYICEPLWNNSLLPQQNGALLPDLSTPPPGYSTGYPTNHQPAQRSCSVTEQIMHNYSIPPVGHTIEQQQSFLAAYSQPKAQQQSTFVPVMAGVQQQTGQMMQNDLQNDHHQTQQQYLPMSPTPSDGSIGDESVFGSNSLDGQSSVKLPAVPYFNEHELHQVATTSSYSASTRGDDLPDVLTTRYYFNLGVNYARRLNAQKNRANSSHNMAPPPHMIPNPPQNFVMQP